MERQLWKQIVCLLDRIDKPRGEGRYRFPSVLIVKVWLWAVVHDRPLSWATDPMNWPLYVRRLPLPSNSTMSRRLRSPRVKRMLKQLESLALLQPTTLSLVSLIDGKPLVIGGCSKDKQAGYGRAAGGKAKGYKLHALIGMEGSVVEWRIAPMNKDERVMAQRMFRSARLQGYVVADAQYDSNPLHEICRTKGNLQLVAPRRIKAGLGHRRHDPGRLRSMQILESPFPNFGQTLLKQRHEIERYFANLTNWGGALTHLPAWARTYRRVHRWVQAKLVINAVKKRTYAN